MKMVFYITGRVKDIFKTSKGKYIEPSILESYFAEVTSFNSLHSWFGLDQPILLQYQLKLQKMIKI